MGSTMRRVRAAAKMGAIWAGIWFTAGILILLLVGFGAADVPFPLGFAFLGFLAGVTFSAFLILVEGRRRFDQFSLRRFGGWGAAGGALLGIVFGALTGLGADILVLAPILAFAGGASASATLLLAQRAERQRLTAAITSDDPRLLDG
jgi:hypothetical protein